MGAVAKSYMRKGFPIYEELRKYLVMYMRRSLVTYLRKILFSFYQFGYIPFLSLPLSSLNVMFTTFLCEIAFRESIEIFSDNNCKRNVFKYLKYAPLPCFPTL